MSPEAMPPFIPGLELSHRFYHEVIRPVLDVCCPTVAHAAAHLGFGSDVLGSDTPMSMDHGWGPTVRIFLREGDAPHAEELRALLDERLPERPVRDGDGRPALRRLSS